MIDQIRATTPFTRARFGSGKFCFQLDTVISDTVISVPTASRSRLTAVTRLYLTRLHSGGLMMSDGNKFYEQNKTRTPETSKTTPPIVEPSLKAAQPTSDVCVDFGRTSTLFRRSRIHYRPVPSIS